MIVGGWGLCVSASLRLCVSIKEVMPVKAKEANAIVETVRKE